MKNILLSLFTWVSIMSYGQNTLYITNNTSLPFALVTDEYYNSAHPSTPCTPTGFGTTVTVGPYSSTTIPFNSSSYEFINSIEITQGTTSIVRFVGHPTGQCSGGVPAPNTYFPFPNYAGVAWALTGTGPNNDDEELIFNP